MPPSVGGEKELIGSNMGNIPFRNRFAHSREDATSGNNDSNNPRRRRNSHSTSSSTKQQPSLKPNASPMTFTTTTDQSSISGSDSLNAFPNRQCMNPDSPTPKPQFSSTMMSPWCTIPSESCTSSNSSLKDKMPPRKPCPVQFQCAHCQGDVRKPSMDVIDSTNHIGNVVDEVEPNPEEPVLQCTSPYCEAQFHLRCSRVPEKSQIYYNATNSGQRKPLSPGSISKSNDAAWWNIPIRNSLQSNDDIVPDQLLTSSDALFGSFQLYDKDPMSSLSSFVCPSCDVEGSSRYLLEYFELFHAMKKTFYSQYLTDDTPVRRDRMSECVESRTGDGILEYLVKVHATDCQLSGGGILRMCAASELNILHMANVRQFLSKQLPSDSPKQIEDCTSIVENNIANKKKREVDDRRTCTDENTSPKTSPSKKKIKMDFDAATAIQSKASRGVSNGQSSHGQNYPRPKEIYYHKSKNKYEVKAQGKKFLGIYNTYEEASYVLEVHNSSCDKNSPFTEDGNNKVERPAMLPLGVSPVKASQIDKAMLEVNEHGQVNIHSNDLELGALSSPKGTEGELHEKTSRGIYYNETMRRWQVFADDQTFIGAYQCYEDAIESLHSSNNTWINESPRESENISDDEHTANVSKKTSCTDPIISLNASSSEKTKDEAPTNHSGSQQQDKLDPSYLVGMSIMLFNPVDNLYHSGRIVDCRLNAPKADDSTIRYKSSIGRLLDDDISKAMYLIRFREGADGRKVAIHQWVYLEEHAVRVGGEVCWARISNEMKGKNSSSPYRPVQIIFRSMLEQISTLQNLEAGEEMKSNATTILANGFGNMFSFISITMDDNIINSLNHDSIEFVEPAENNHSDAATINDITKRPVIFPFRASDPLWLNQILRRVRLCDEEIGVACAMATAEQEACRLVRSGMKKA